MDPQQRQSGPIPVRRGPPPCGAPAQSGAWRPPRRPRRERGRTTLRPGAGHASATRTVRAARRWRPGSAARSRAARRRPRSAWRASARRGGRCRARGRPPPLADGARAWIDSGPLGLALYTPTTDATASSAPVAEPSSRCRRNENAVIRGSVVTGRVSGVGVSPIGAVPFRGGTTVLSCAPRRARVRCVRTQPEITPCARGTRRAPAGGNHDPSHGARPGRQYAAPPEPYDTAA